jgi:hypothetical protein
VVIYDAFISYCHAKDKPIAAALQPAVQKLGKPWYRRQALCLFRDDTGHAATLWPSVERALAQSRYLILLASPEAAASPSVGKEVAWWLANKSADTILIGLTAGELVWDNAAGNVARRDPLPLPATLAGALTAEPKWIDLRDYRRGAHGFDRPFVGLAAELAAVIQGVPLGDLVSAELRQQRRALALAWSAVGSLLIFVGVAGWQWKTAIDAERACAEVLARLPK